MQAVQGVQGTLRARDRRRRRLVWSSLSLFSALESALNIVWGRPNRPSSREGDRGRSDGAMPTLFVGLLAGASVSSVLTTTAGVAAARPRLRRLDRASRPRDFAFLLAVYRWLPNTPVDVREALPGAILGAIVLEASFQVVPYFVRLADVKVDAAGARRPGDPARLAVRDGERDRLRGRAQLVVAGAAPRGGGAVTEASRRRRLERQRVSARAARARCECSPFQASPSSATVRVLAVRDEDRVVAEAFAARAARAAIRPSSVPVPRNSLPSGESATSSET